MHRTLSVLALVLASTAIAAEPGRWAFEPKPDEFRPDALLDLRSLNEPITGFVRASPEGDFLNAAGQPLRFWAVNTSVQDPLPPHSLFPKRDLERHARWLAKRGVNMVRWHGAQYPLAGKNGASDDPMAVNREALDGLWRLVAAMKKEGIYTTISPYWANALKVPATWGLGGPDKEDAHGLLFFHPKMQAAYHAWLRVLFTEPNPYTGVPLANEPAVAIIQLQNEDSLLFWTFNAISTESKALLARQFRDWVMAKYGTVHRAQAAWGGTRIAGDTDVAYGFFNLYDLTPKAAKPSEGKAKRLADQTQFLTETMLKFNAATVAYLKNDLGCKQLVNCGNWRTADAAALGDAERYSYTAGDVIGVNRYFGSPHVGERRGWAIMAGDRYADASILDQPWELPLALRQVRGLPTIISECSWTSPNGRQAESAFLAAAYQSLTGVDAVYWFATGATEWQQPMAANGFARDTVGKWVIATPEQVGQFPAAALAFRRGLIARGTPALLESRLPDDLWNRKPPLIVEEAGFDPNRDVGDAADRTVGGKVDPLAFLVGPVEVSFRNADGGTRVSDLSRYIDRKAKIVRSNTGEIAFDWGRRVATIDAPQVQGVCGYLNSAGGSFGLRDLTVVSNNDYAAILAVSLDGKPLASSSNVLVQVGTESRPTNWKAKPARIQIRNAPTVDGSEVVAIGSAPWSVVNAMGRLVIRNAALTRATALDQMETHCVS
ncbi:MAG: hypothetical protein U0746_00705 [Gemmataceae bacterium]